MSPAQYVSVSLATCVGLCRFGEAWAALWAENLLTYLEAAYTHHEAAQGSAGPNGATGTFLNILTSSVCPSRDRGLEARSARKAYHIYIHTTLTNIRLAKHMCPQWQP